MQVNVYEKYWMWGAGVLVALFVGALLWSAGAHAIHPPSHVETIDPTKVAEHPEFGNPGVITKADGGLEVVITIKMYSFAPAEIRVPRGKPVTFRITSSDVIHGFQIVRTNANTMVIPGYVSQFSMTFQWPGEYLIVCNEFCGLGHHLMQAKLIVEEAA